MAGGELAPAVTELTSYWWDSYDEEMGPNTMGPAAEADSTCSRPTASAAERDARIAACAPRATSGLRSRASAPSAPPASSSFSGPETLGARFARGPRPPPAPSGGGPRGDSGLRRPGPDPASSAGVGIRLRRKRSAAAAASTPPPRSNTTRRDGVPGRAAGRGQPTGGLFHRARRGLRSRPPTTSPRITRFLRAAGAPAGARRVPRRRGTRLHPRGGKRSRSALALRRRRWRAGTDGAAADIRPPLAARALAPPAPSTDRRLGRAPARARRGEARAVLGSPTRPYTFTTALRRA